MSKIQISIVCGGQSTEHEISILSARNVVEALDKKKYEVSIIYIDPKGFWFLLSDTAAFSQVHPQLLIEKNKSQALKLCLGETQKMFCIDNENFHNVDCVFPVLHGTKGEDGTIQGLFELNNIPYVGSGVLGSAVCMDKHVSKQIMRFAKLPTTDWITLRETEITQYSYEQVVKQLGTPFFVKPASLGSSVGISKVKNAQQYVHALAQAFQYDERVMLEAAMTGREIECSVLGNNDPVASLPGEIITTKAHEFYSYAAKYLDPEGAHVVCPADLPANIVKSIQDLSIQAFKVLQCAGMARVDFFVDNDKIVLNEVNTIPGFTNISMYPKNWLVSGIKYGDLLDDLIQLAFTRHRDQQAIKRVFAHREESNNSREINDRPSY